MQRLHMVIFLYGKDTLRSRQQLRKMVEKFKVDRDPTGMNVVKLDCEKTNEAEQVLEQILAIPFLAERRMVVIENLLLSKQSDLKAEILKRVEEKMIPESTVVLFWEGTDTFKTKDSKELLERLSKEKYAQPFELFTGAKLTGWIAAELEARGAKIEMPALSFLAQHAGADMWRLNSLIDQFVSFKKNAPITLADVQLFVDEKADDNIFNLIDAIVAKQPKKVFAMIEEQYKKGEDAGYIFAMLVRQYRILLEMKDATTRQDMTSDVLAKQLGIHPFVAKKSLPIVKKYTLAELEGVYDRLLKIDIATKTGQGQLSTMVDLFVAKVSSQ